MKLKNPASKSRQKVVPPAPPALDHFARAVQLYQDGLLADAETSCDLHLAEKPDSPDGLHLLGVILGQTGRESLAADRISAAIRLNPGIAGYYSSLGVTRQRQGHLAEAAAAFQRAAELDPGNAAAHEKLGLAYMRQRDFARAVRSFEAARDLNPAVASIQYNLGVALQESGRNEAAIAAYRAAIANDPSMVAAYNNIGAALHLVGQFDEAIAFYKRAIEFNPNNLDALYNLGIALDKSGDTEAAITTYRRLLTLDRAQAKASNNLGAALYKQGRLEEAAEVLRGALQWRSDDPLLHYNLAITLLHSGDFAAGWVEHEWRFRKIALETNKLPRFSRPMWTGENAPGGTLFLWWEQGFGDSIQFIRYIPEIQKRGYRVILKIQPALRQLLEPMADVTLFCDGEPQPDFDVHCPLLSIPFVLGTTLETVPGDVPYLTPPSAKMLFWQARLAPLSGLRLGLVWRGNPAIGRPRDIEPARLRALVDMPGVSVVSLQQDAGAEELAALTGGTQILDAGPSLVDFSDTAALIANLDLVISVDTAVCHLAGALGKPVWTLLPFMNDWRWLSGRSDSPWYPTMRLFRQTTPDDWDTPVAAVYRALEAELAKGHPDAKPISAKPVALKAATEKPRPSRTRKKGTASA